MSRLPSTAQHGDAAAEHRYRGQPLRRLRGGAPAGGLGDGEEHSQCRADDEHGGPRGAGHVLAGPHPAQHHEDKLSDQNGLEHRQQAVMQGKSLEDERAHRSHSAEQPQRLPDQVDDQPPALLPLRARRCSPSAASSS